MPFPCSRGCPGANGQPLPYSTVSLSFGCSTTYKLPSPNGGLKAHYADDFDCLEAETQRSDDPMAYVLGVDRTTLMQRKFVTGGAAIFIRRLSPARFGFSFRLTLAVALRWTAMSTSTTTHYERHPIDWVSVHTFGQAWGRRSLPPNTL
jgi:hypothetical protein